MESDILKTQTILKISSDTNMGMVWRTPTFMPCKKIKTGIYGSVQTKVSLAGIGYKINSITMIIGTEYL